MSNLKEWCIYTTVACAHRTERVFFCMFDIRSCSGDGTFSFDLLGEPSAVPCSENPMLFTALKDPRSVSSSCGFGWKEEDTGMMEEGKEDLGLLGY